MLLGLRVKNFALIREASLSFDTGFTVLSGETGAGKSILIDSISALLGAKTGRDMIRNGEEAAYLELIFSVRQKELRERLAALSIVPEEDGTVIVSRKIQKTRSISRINGEAVTARQLKELAALLIDIHGQHEVQTLFSTEMHGRLLDELLPPAGQAAREAYAEAYRAYRQLLRQERESADRAALLREADLLAFEIRELAESGIHPGEEAELAEAYASAKHAAQIEEALAEAERALQTDAVSEALRAVRAVVRYTTSLEALAGQLTELAALNFKGARFEVRFAELSDFAESGSESAEFYIRTNPGEEIKPLRQIASGGELSRVMLALQTVLAAKDRVETLIFDEIDAGISGRTAQLVSEKLMEISRTRQVLCITHLPQLAAMADHHYLIAKETDGSKTETEIREITGEALYLELGRLIGGAEITAGVLKTAEEMKQLAEKRKEEMR